MNYQYGWRNLAWMIVLTIGLVFLANLVAYACLKNYPANRAISRVWQKWQILEKLDRPVDWVIVGDSSCGQGVRPDVLRRELGVNAINLCTVANATIVNQAWMVERYIQKFGPPSAVVMFNVFHTWERESGDLISMLDQIPLPGDFWSSMHPPLSVDSGQAMLLHLKPILTLFSQNMSIQHLISMLPKAIAEGSFRELSSATRDIESMIKAGGYTQENTARPEKVATDIVKHIEAYKDRPFRISQENLAALRSISELSLRHSFKLYVSNSSIANGLYAHPGILRFFTEMLTRLKSELAANANAVLVLQIPPTYDPDQMDNVDHVVGSEGAYDLTMRLTQSIRESWTKQQNGMEH